MSEKKVGASVSCLSATLPIRNPDRGVSRKPSAFKCPISAARSQKAHLHAALDCTIC
ncbi:Uncharacterized protein DAT39_006946 [Clarias magur]|uniref:Uncharacterized protein n=1 Tax=Clarias magur TaxID=1594786 RepID=A0A8J4UTQ9_CLAMG|nr:Uncharacterized protein DAT39_006946 [Clarias magur]